MNGEKLEELTTKMRRSTGTTSWSLAHDIINIIKNYGNIFMGKRGIIDVITTMAEYIDKQRTEVQHTSHKVTHLGELQH